MFVRSIFKSILHIKWGKILIAAVLVANLGLTAATPVSASSSCDQDYVVQVGDTLAIIAARYGTNWATLAANNNIANANIIYVGQRICVDGTANYSTTTSSSSSSSYTTATLTISSVKADKRFTVHTYKFPNREKYQVFIAPYGEMSSDADSVGYLITDMSGGEVVQTYKIPSDIRGENKYSVRLKSIKSGKQFDTWFYNDTVGTGGADTTVSTALDFSVSSLIQNKTITLTFVNVNANERYRIYVGEYGTKGDGGDMVGSFKLSSAGSYSATYKLPGYIKGDKKFDVLLVNVPSGNTIYHTVKNITTP
jgi:LysM repeat protein